MGIIYKSLFYIQETLLWDIQESSGQDHHLLALYIHLIKQHSYASYSIKNYKYILRELFL